jgi:hypothetical protein
MADTTESDCPSSFQASSVIHRGLYAELNPSRIAPSLRACPEPAKKCSDRILGIVLPPGQVRELTENELEPNGELESWKLVCCDK